jgi:hypothetical protein
MGENIFFTINPEVWEAFLSGVKNLSQITKASFLVKNFVSFAELFSIVSGGTIRFENFAKSFNLVQKAFTRTLAVF